MPADGYGETWGRSLRHPPSNLQAEQALLGAILTNNKAFHRVVGFLKPDHFYDPTHGVIYRECARLILRGHMVDAVVLQGVFEQSEALAPVGGAGYLGDLLVAMVGILSAAEYGRVIHDAWLRRQLIEVGTDIVERAFGANLELDGEAQMGAASDALLDLSSAASKDAPEISAGDAAREAIREAEEWSRPGSNVLRTGLAPLDAAIGPLFPGWFYILGGRPGMGKTSLATQMATSVARTLQREEQDAPPFSGAGGDVVIFSLEMPAKQLAGWMACQIAGISNDVLQGTLMSQAQAEAMLRAQRELDSLPIRIIDAVGMSGPAMALRVRSMHAKRRVRFVVVDHIQKVVASADSAKNGEVAATARTTSALKDLARQVGCPVLALAQLKRDVDQRDDPRPRLSDLMYAGETDCDVAFFLFRQERYLKKTPPEKFNVKETDENHAKRVDHWHRQWDAARNRAEVIVAKRRAGSEGVKALRFDGPTVTFSEIGGAANWGDLYEPE